MENMNLWNMHARSGFSRFHFRSFSVKDSNQMLKTICINLDTLASLIFGSYICWIRLTSPTSSPPGQIKCGCSIRNIQHLLIIRVLSFIMTMPDCTLVADIGWSNWGLTMKLCCTHLKISTCFSFFKIHWIDCKT